MSERSSADVVLTITGSKEDFEAAAHRIVFEAARSAGAAECDTLIHHVRPRASSFVLDAPMEVIDALSSAPEVKAVISTEDFNAFIPPVKSD